MSLEGMPGSLLRVAKISDWLCEVESEMSIGEELRP